MLILSNVLGLDIGSHSLKAVEIRQTLRGVEAVALRILPRVNDDSPLSELIGHFIRMHRLSTEHVVTAVAGDRVSARRFSFPFRDRKKLTQAVPFEVEGDTPFDLDDVLVDWEIAGGGRNRSEIVATIATRVDVAQLLEVLGEANCEPRTIEAEGLVLGNLTSLFELPGTRLLVDLGHRKTSCCLISEGRPIAARSFPIGGAALTDALAADRGISREDAERAKCEDGIFAGSIADAPPKSAALVDRIAREIVRTLGAMEADIGSLASGPVTGLTLCGGTAQLDRLPEYLSEHTGVVAARLGLPTPGHGDGLAAGGSPIVFAPAIALALRGTARAKTRMNFRQDEFAMRLNLGRFRKDLIWPASLSAAAIVLALVSSGISTTLEKRRAQLVEQRVEQLYTQVFPGQAVPQNPITSLREAVQSASERAEFLGVYRGNMSALDLLAEISNHVPDDLDIVLEELRIDRQTIRMKVHARSFEAADRLGAELAKFPPFGRARIGSIETDSKRGSKRFDVTISLEAPEGPT